MTRRMVKYSFHTDVVFRPAFGVLSTPKAGRNMQHPDMRKLGSKFVTDRQTQIFGTVYRWMDEFATALLASLAGDK